MEGLRIGREVSGPSERTLARLSHLLVSEGWVEPLPTSSRAAGSLSIPGRPDRLLDDRFGLVVEEVNALGHEGHADLLVGLRSDRRLHAADHRLAPHAHVEQDL